MKRLSLHLDFLNEADRNTVLDFYRNRLDGADTLSDEEKIVASFGMPEEIAEKLKDAFFRPDPKEESEKGPEKESEESDDEIDSAESSPEDANLPSESESSSESEDVKTAEEEAPLEESLPDDRASDGEDDLIFSKNITPEKAPEVIHSLENKESKTLYGEKVIIEEKSEPTETFTIPDSDDENDLTAEEIQKAKAETLEKAEEYSRSAFGEEESDPAEKEEKSAEPEKAKPAEKEEKAPVFIEENDEIEPQAPKKKTIGILSKMFANTSLPKGLVLFFKIFISIIISPIIITMVLGCTLFYALAVLVLALTSLLMIVFVGLLIAFAVMELVHSIVLFFDRISVALIELGLATVLFALVVAIIALVYEFLFSIFPKAIKVITSLFARLVKGIFANLYGGNA